MAFVLSKKPSYAWPVKVKFPVGGRWETQQFTATFARLPPRDVQDRLKALAEPDLSVEDRLDRENDFIAEVLLGWEGIKDDQDVPVPYTPDTRSALLDVIEVRRALFEAFFESALGRKAEVKN